MRTSFMIDLPFSISAFLIERQKMNRRLLLTNEGKEKQEGNYSEDSGYAEDDVFMPE